MKKILAFIFTILILITPLTALADESVDLGESVASSRALKAIITAPSELRFGDPLPFSANNTYNPLIDSELSIWWEFGDDRTETESAGRYRYLAPGEYTLRLSVNNGEDKDIVEKKVFVYEKEITIIVDDTISDDTIKTFQAEAKQKNISLKTIYLPPKTLFSKETVFRTFRYNLPLILKSDLLIFFTTRDYGLSIFSNFVKEEPRIDFKDKELVMLTADNLSMTARLAEITYRILQPRSILVARPEAIYSAFDSDTTIDVLVTELEKAVKEYRLIDSSTLSFKGYNFLSRAINYLLASGIPENTVLLLLLLPVIATLISILRQIVGVYSLGIYIPSIITVTFLIMGYWIGLLSLILVFSTGAIIRASLRKLRLLYIPRMAVVLSGTSAFILIYLYLGSYFGMENLNTISIFPVLVLILILEKFIAVQAERGLRFAGWVLFETIVVSSIVYALITQIESLRSFLLVYPETVLLLILLNVFLGRWTGLRIAEYFRFHELLRDQSYELDDSHEEE